MPSTSFKYHKDLVDKNYLINRTEQYQVDADRMFW